MRQTTETAAVSFSQIAALVGVAPNHLRSDLLPPSITVHTGEPGRPMQVVALEDLAQFILDRTGHLNDAECRLRLAMTNKCTRKRTCAKPGPFYLVPNGDGTFAMRPLLHTTDLTHSEQVTLRAAIGEQP